MLLVGLCYTMMAQPVISVKAAKSKIRTGEPDTLTLTATWPGHDLQQGFVVADSFPHFEVWDKGAVVQQAAGISQQIVVTGYDSGRFDFPALRLAADNQYATQVLPINIEPVNVDSLKDYHDIKDIIDVPAPSRWPWILLAVLLLAGAVVGCWYYFKKRKKHDGGKKLPKAGAYERAIEALLMLEKQTGVSTAKPFFTSLTSVYRTYLSEAYHWHSQQQTGGELLMQARPLLDDAVYQSLTNAIRMADAVKFARYEPSVSEWMPALQSIRQVIDVLNGKLKER